MSDASKSASVPIRVGVRELRGNLTRYLREVRAGRAVLVTSRNAVVAELRPPAPDRRAPRQLGVLRGKIHIAEDFNTWPDDILDAMER